MAIFRYKGMNEVGKMVQGRIDAVNETDLEARLGKMGLELISCRQAAERSGGFSRRKISRRDLITFCFHMDRLTRVGVPILASLQDLRDSMENPRFREVISALIPSIEGGKTFSEALAGFPRVFDEVFVNLVRAGEQSGELSDVLRNIAESLKWQDELAAQTKKVMMYPAFVGAVVMGVIFFLMIYLVPQMVGFINNMGHEIPGHTIALIAFSEFIASYWYAILLAPAGLWFMLNRLAHTRPGVRLRLDDLKLRLWVIGPILRKIILSRFANYFALLYSSGVTVLSSMKISEAIAGNAAIAAALRDAGQQIADGKNMSESFSSVGLFPPLVLRMIKVGESTGALDDALLNVSYFYNRDIKEAIDRLQSMVEPVMTVVLGLILGWVMLSVLGPIYDMISKVKV